MYKLYFWIKETPLCPLMCHYGDFTFLIEKIYFKLYHHYINKITKNNMNVIEKSQN